MNFNDLNEEVKRGLSGYNNGVPMGFPKLNKHIGIRKRIMTLIFGSSGSGKSAFLHSAYILNPFDYLSTHSTGVKFKVILFSMERSPAYIMMKWISRRIFLEQGILIPIPKLLGWWDVKLTNDEHDLFLSCEDYIGNLLETVDIIEGPQNPMGVKKYVKAYADANGKFESISEYKNVYVPNNPNEIVIVALDHMGLTKTEKDYNTKKEAIDRLSEHCQYFRDALGYSPVLVSQLNRNLNNPLYQKMDNFAPTIDDVKESGNPGEASDVIVSLFDPLRYRTNDKTYNANKFIEPTSGGNYFRSIKVLKNSYGEDSLTKGMAFHGATGMFKELPNKSEMEDFDYSSVFNGTYFLE